MRPMCKEKSKKSRMARDRVLKMNLGPGSKNISFFCSKEFVLYFCYL